jgi:hypothetical protein
MAARCGRIRLVPARSNFFQQVVLLLHRNIAGADAVEESAMLLHRLTSEPREVDVVIRSTSAGYPLVVSIEANSRARIADVGWVEQMHAKHQHLETNQLVLVSERGFSSQADALAQAHGILALTPVDLTGEDPEGKIVNRLPSLWPKLLSLTPETIRLHVRTPDGRELWFAAQPDHTLFFDDGVAVTYIATFVLTLIRKRFIEIADQIGLRDIAQDLDRGFRLEVGGAFATVDQVRRDLFVRYEMTEPPEFHAVLQAEVVGRARIEVREMELRHRRLGEVAFSEGQFEFNELRAIVVVSEDQLGGGAISMRWERSSAENEAIR